MPKFFEHHKRSIAKTLTWRVFATIITGGVIYYFTRDLFQATSITILGAIASTFGYYIHERVWNRIHWGKEHRDEIANYQKF